MLKPKFLELRIYNNYSIRFVVIIIFNKQPVEKAYRQHLLI